MKIAIILKAPKLDVPVCESHVIYADGAYAYREGVGDKVVLAVVGDFDSLSTPPKNENNIILNEEKNFTDGERAVRFAKEYGAEEVVIYGANGGKLEHVLGNVALLKIASDIGLKAQIKDARSITRLIDGKVELKIKTGAKLSLIPYGGNAKFVSSRVLYYKLDGLTLTPADTVGISNYAVAENVEIEIKKGQALMIYEY